MDVVRVGQIRKTGIVVKFECKMYGKETDEYLYVFSVKVRNIVYKRLCIKKYVKEKYNFEKMCVIDFEEKDIHSFMNFCKEAFNL